MKAEQVNIAFRDFLFTMGVRSDIPECPVIPGYNNRTVRPGTTEYVIYTPIMQPLISRKAHFWLPDSGQMENDSAFDVEPDGYFVPNAIPAGKTNPFFENDGEGYLADKGEAAPPVAATDSVYELDDAGYLVDRPIVPADRWVVGNIQQVTYQVDAWGKSAHARMSRLKNIFEDSIGYEFFRSKYKDFYGGIGIVGASDIRNMSEASGTSDYEWRYSADFKITATVEDEWKYQGIDAVDFELIKAD